MSSDDPRALAEGGLVQLRRKVDDHFVLAVRRSPDAFACRPGCSSCCVQFGVLEVEADRVRAALRDLASHDPALREQIRGQGREAGRTACALLVDDRCSVYDERPIICRSHGLPIRVTHDDGSSSIETCPLNFVDTPATPASILKLDAVNAPLSVIARMWAPDGERIALADVAAGDD